MAGSVAGMGWMQAGLALVDAYNTREAGKMQKIQLERQQMYQAFNQWAGDRQAGVVIAASQRTAAEERRQADLIASRALAVAAASGGGVSDPTVVDILARTRGEGAFRAQVALYEGEERARAIRISGAGGSDFDASSQVMAGANAAAAGRLAKTGLSLYARYGMGGPGTTPSQSPSGSNLDWNTTGDFGGSADAPVA